MDKIRIIFLCTGSSCRSQMAEGWMRELAPDNVIVKSAGIEAHGQNAYAIKVMAEEGIDISKRQSIKINSEMFEWSDLMVTLCENADKQCPVIKTDTVTLHLPLADPAKFKGTDEELLADFRESRRKIKKRVQHVIERLTQLK